MRATTILLLVLVGLAVNSVAGGKLDKRFFLDDLQEALRQLYIRARDAFNTVRDRIGALGVNFQMSLQRLGKFLQANETQTQCVNACKTNSKIILGEDHAQALCDPLCDAFLDRLHEITG